MSEIIIKADIRAVRRFLAKLSTDERLDAREQWLAEQSLIQLNNNVLASEMLADYYAKTQEK